MKVWFKRGLFSLVVLAIVTVVGGAIFLLTFNPNSYKQKLADIVQQKYQRTLKIDGDIELSLFPRIGLSVQGLSLSDRNSEDPFASLESARFAVASSICESLTAGSPVAACIGAPIVSRVAMEGSTGS